MNKNGLTITVIFEAESANYGEGIGNISQLKKFTRADGKIYSYISRQAVRYNIVQQMQCDNTPIEDQGVAQFAPSATIEDYPEIDLFGYMKTTKGGQTVRSAAVRLSNAIALKPYTSDMDFLTNMGMAKRAGLNNAIAQSEIHNSLYTYTITIDLDRVGIDGEIEISKEERAKRIIKLLDTVEFLYRDIKGRRENMSPIFAIGGVYERKNPYFENRIEMNKTKLNVDMIKEVVNSCDDTKDNTYVGMLKGKFSNIDEIEELKPLSIAEMFDKLKKEVEAYYA